MYLNTVKDVKMHADAKEYLKILVAFYCGLILSPAWRRLMMLLRKCQLFPSSVLMWLPQCSSLISVLRADKMHVNVSQTVRLLMVTHPLP